MTVLNERVGIEPNDTQGLLVRGSLLDTEVRAQALLNADCVDQCFFIANRTYLITDVRYVHATAGNDAGAVNLQITKDTGTQAPGAGTDLLTDNSNAGFNCKGTANTVQQGTLVASEATRTLAPGDRLSWDFAGTVSNLAGVAMTVSLRRI